MSTLGKPNFNTSIHPFGKCDHCGKEETLQSIDGYHSKISSKCFEKFICEKCHDSWIRAFNKWWNTEPIAQLVNGIQYHVAWHKVFDEWWTTGKYTGAEIFVLS